MKISHVVSHEYRMGAVSPTVSSKSAFGSASMNCGERSIWLKHTATGMVS